MTRRTFTSITIDGQTYASADEMPPAVRAKYDRLMGRLQVDRDGNGVPDLFEGGTVDGADVVHVTTTHSEVYDINGGQYTRLDEMPPDVRRLVAQVRGQVGGPTPWPADDGIRTSDPRHHNPGGGIHIRLSWGTLAWLGGGLLLAAAWLAWTFGTR